MEGDDTRQHTVARGRKDEGVYAMNKCIFSTIFFWAISFCAWFRHSAPQPSLLLTCQPLKNAEVKMSSCKCSGIYADRTLLFLDLRAFSGPWKRSIWFKIYLASACLLLPSRVQVTDVLLVFPLTQWCSLLSLQILWFLMGI